MRWHVGNFGTEALEKEEIEHEDVWLVIDIGKEELTVRNWHPETQFLGDNPTRQVRKDRVRKLDFSDIVRLELRP